MDPVTNTPGSIMEAITLFETADSNLRDADGKKSLADEKFRMAQETKSSADATRQGSAVGFNAAIDALISAATAAKIQV